MKITAPSYYTSFRCKADKCVHNCCIGWEIAVDDDTLELYNYAGTSLAEKICENIDYTSDGAQFRIDENKKCPFLLENGLCHIIKEQGEGWLCQICRDHPRFRNYFSDRIETGLGMCCEEAARLILSSKDNSAVTLEDDRLSAEPDTEDEELFRRRDKIFEILHDNELSFSDAVRQIMSQLPGAEINRSPMFWYGFLNSLECMNEDWHCFTEALCSKEDNIFDFGGVSQNACRNLLEYFFYRHLPKVFEGHTFQACISFCVVCTALICFIFRHRKAGTFEDFAEISRMFSCEIEYSDENTEAMMNMLE